MRFSVQWFPTLHIYLSFLVSISPLFQKGSQFSFRMMSLKIAPSATSAFLESRHLHVSNKQRTCHWCYVDRRPRQVREGWARRDLGVPQGGTLGVGQQGTSIIQPSSLVFLPLSHCLGILTILVPLTVWRKLWHLTRRTKSSSSPAGESPKERR